MLPLQEVIVEEGLHISKYRKWVAQKWWSNNLLVRYEKIPSLFSKISFLMEGKKDDPSGDKK